MHWLYEYLQKKMNQYQYSLLAEQKPILFKGNRKKISNNHIEFP